MAVINFDHENWEPPDKELRALRKEFFGPLTDELLKVSMAGEMEEGDNSKKAPQTLAQKSAVRSQEKFRRAATKVSLLSRVVGGMGDSAAAKWAQDKWFVSWQDKRCIRLEPPIRSPEELQEEENDDGSDHDDDEKRGGDDEEDSDGAVSSGGGSSSRRGSKKKTPRPSSTAVTPMGSRPGSPTAIMMSRGLQLDTGEGQRRRPRFVKGRGGGREVVEDAVSLLPKGTVAMRLFCFPWEGGSAGIFEQLSLTVEHACHVISITYPGRLNRCREPTTAAGGDDRTIIRNWGRECAAAMVAAGLVGDGGEDSGDGCDVPFCLLGHGMGALVAYEVARHLRKHHELQPSLFFVLQAPGPQSFSGDLDDDNEDDEDGGGGGDGGGDKGPGPAGRDAPLARQQDAVKLSEVQSNEALYEHLVTTERGCLPASCVDQKSLFVLGLPLYRADCRAYESFRYESDWTFARPFVVVTALFDGQLSQAQISSWELESSKAVEVVETCGGARTMLRDKAMVQELGALVVAKVHAELRRPFDPEAEEMDRVARGLPPSY